MSLFFRQSERRSGGGWASPWAHSGAAAQSTTSAMRLIPVYSAVSLISEAIGSLPCKAYRRLPDGGRELLPVQPSLVRDPGVARVSRVTWRAQAMVSLLLRGNAYGLIAGVDASGSPSKVQWLDPSRVTVLESDTAAPRYFLDGRPLPDELMIHIPAVTPPGSVVGLSPISLFRIQIETGMKASELARRWYANGVAPSGKLRNSEKVVSAAEADVVKARFKAAVSSGDLFVTGKDWDYDALTVSPADAQFLESIKATATQIAAIYHVPPEEIGGETGNSMTYSTVELNGLRFGQRAVQPWTARFEAALDGVLPKDTYVKFSLDSLARADLKTRVESKRTELESGTLTLDEARALEDRAPLTAEQKAEWQELFKGKSGSATAREIAEQIQKIYLGVDKVITSDEARQIINQGGATLDLPGPVFPKSSPKREGTS